MIFFRPNIDRKGRVARGVIAAVLSVAAFSTWRFSRAAGLTLAASAGFVAYEAARGWCALRACGVKTKY